jgi:hypothetical protein
VAWPRPAPGTGKWWAVGIVGITAAVAVVIWWGWTSTAGAVSPVVDSYLVTSDSSIQVVYELARPQGVAVQCRVSALDSRKGRVGTTLDDVPADGPAVVRREVTIRTSARAVTGVVESCVRMGASGG